MSKKLIILYFSLGASSLQAIPCPQFTPAEATSAFAQDNATHTAKAPDGNHWQFLEVEQADINQTINTVHSY